MDEKARVYGGLKRKNRFLGIIDYKTLVILLGYMWIVWKTHFLSLFYYNIFIY